MGMTRLTRCALVLLFWIAAAALVATSHRVLDRRSPIAGATAAIASIVTVAYAYTRLCARDTGLEHAMAVGIAWLALAIVTEIAISGRSGHGWHSLIGTPDHPLFRHLILFVWIFAPALFERRRVETPKETMKIRRINDIAF